jgi:hypothetical protein
MDELLALQVKNELCGKVALTNVSRRWVLLVYFVDYHERKAMDWVLQELPKRGGWTTSSRFCQLDMTEIAG